MHFTKLDEAITAGDADVLEDEPDAGCVKGCYRCLLSYYNQPDQELIDRTDPDAKRLLLRLACSEVMSVAADSTEVLNQSWVSAFRKAGIHGPDAEPMTVGTRALPFVWRSHLVAASDAHVRPEERAQVEALGYALIELPPAPSPSALADLRRLLGVAN